MTRRRRLLAPLLASTAALCLTAATTSCSVVHDAAVWKTPSAGPDAGGGAATGGASSAATAPLPPVYNVAPLINPSHKYLGVEMPGSPDSLGPAQQFASWIGKKPDMLGQYVGWNSGLDVQAVKNAWSYGALYFQVWEPFNVTLQQIAQGASDDYINRFATSVRALNLPIALSFGHEMNGDWYPWGTKTSTPAQFVAAWRHVHDLFVKAGATNVIWIWNPNDIHPVPDVKLQPLYPGDAYVDWVGVTAYWSSSGGPHTYGTLLLPTLLQIRTFTNKPFIIAETSAEPGSNQVSSVHALFNAIATHGDILGFVWYDYDRQGDWRLENRPTVQSAFKSEASSSQFGFDVSGAR